VWAAEGRLYEAFLQLNSDLVDIILKSNPSSQNIQLVERLDELSSQNIQLVERLDELSSQNIQLVERLDELQESVRLSISYFRMIQQNTPRATSLPTEIRGNSIVKVIERLELEAGLNQAKKVDVTIQSGGAEEEIALIATYLDKRLCVATPQLWYYIDFNPDWHQQTLFESAQNKVEEGGKFVVITEFGGELSAQNGDTNMIFEREHTLPDINVTAYIWRNG
jgi:hypothetical protein